MFEIKKLAVNSLHGFPIKYFRCSKIYKHLFDDLMMCLQQLQDTC